MGTKAALKKLETLVGNHLVTEVTAHGVQLKQLSAEVSAVHGLVTALTGMVRTLNDKMHAFIEHFPNEVE